MASVPLAPTISVARESRGMPRERAARPIEAILRLGEPDRMDRRSERGLVREAQRGSQEAVEELFRRFWPRAYRAAWVVTHDAAAAEDIAQEAFLSALRSLHRFDRRRPFGPWMHRIAVNRAIDHTRARTLRGEVAEVAVAAAAPTGAQEIADPRLDELQGAIAELTPEHRAVIAMRFVLDLTPGEIADALEIPRGTVNSRLRRALDHLAESIGDDR
jgi:RNA polymerase sigma-70 factor, ECF subfamily